MSLVHFRGVPAKGSTVVLSPGAVPRGTTARVWAGLRRAAAGGALDPVVVGIVALVVYALHGYQGTLDRDLGVFVYGGMHVAHGVPPYVGIFNTVGPLADAVPGLAIWLGHFVGVPPILAARVFFTLLSATCCALLAVLGRDLFGSRAGGFLTAAIFLTFEDFLRLASDGPREKTTMVLFLLAALLLMQRHRWLLAGACTALAVLTWQPVLLVAAAAFTMLVIGTPGGRRRAVARFVIGGLVPLALTVVYFASQHALHTAVNGFLLVNLLYNSQTSVFTAEAGLWSLVWADYHASVFVAVAGLVAIVALAARPALRVVRRGERAPTDPRTVLLAALGTAAAFGVAWTMTAFNGPPDLFVLLPFAGLGAAGAVLAVVRRLETRRLHTLVAGLVVVAVVSALFESVVGRTERLAVQRADVRAVMRLAPPGATMLTFDAPEVPALAGIDSITPLQILDTAMQGYIRHQWPGGKAGYIHDVNRLKPTLVAVGSAYAGSLGTSLLARHYWRVGRGPTWIWYARRSVGAQEFTRMLDANRRVMLRAGATVGTINPAERAMRRLAEHRADRVSPVHGRRDGRHHRHRAGSLGIS